MEVALPQILEALIFASPKPLSVPELLTALRGAGESSEIDAAQAMSASTEAEVLDALKTLDEALEKGGRSFRLLEQASGWGFVTRPEYAPWVRQLYPEAKPARLSGPALETLAIIAYRQPVTRADIEAVRGVAVDGVMQVLLDRSLVRIAGRADQPGRPLLYSTTDYFLEHFGLKTTGDLPNASELGRMPLPTAPLVEEKPGRKKDRGTPGGAGGENPELPFADVAASSPGTPLSPEDGVSGTPTVTSHESSPVGPQSGGVHAAEEPGREAASPDAIDPDFS